MANGGGGIGWTWCVTRTRAVSKRTMFNDPISQKDYFAMQAIFAASERTYPEKIRESRIKVLNGFLAEKPLPKELENDARCTLKTEKQAGLRLLHAKQPMEVHLLSRGELNKPRGV